MPLIGRNVIVWPDNDKPGVQAGLDVCSELRRIGVQSLKMVDPLSLKKSYPEKWDLADPLPKDSGKNLPQQLLQNAIQKGLDPQKALYRVSSLYKDDPIDRGRVNEILWRVDDRLRPDLEQNGQRKINEAILNETARILLQKDQGNKKHTPQVLWQTLIFEAQYGRTPVSWEIEKISEVVQKFHASPIPKDRSEELALDRSITSSCEKTFAGHEISANQRTQEVISMSQNLQKQTDHLQIAEKEFRERQKDRTLSPDLIGF